MKRLVAAVVVVALIGLALPVLAAENVAGTWKWTTNFGGQSRDSTVKLKLEGEAVRKARAAAFSNLGDYYRIDTYRNFVVDTFVNLEYLGRELGVLRPGERMAG